MIKIEKVNEIFTSFDMQTILMKQNEIIEIVNYLSKYSEKTTKQFSKVYVSLQDRITELERKCESLQEQLYDKKDA